MKDLQELKNELSKQAQAYSITNASTYPEDWKTRLAELRATIREIKSHPEFDANEPLGVVIWASPECGKPKMIRACSGPMSISPLTSPAK